MPQSYRPTTSGTFVKKSGYSLMKPTLFTVGTKISILLAASCVLLREAKSELYPESGEHKDKSSENGGNLKSESNPIN